MEFYQKTEEGVRRRKGACGVDGEESPQYIIGFFGRVAVDYLRRISFTNHPRGSLILHMLTGLDLIQQILTDGGGGVPIGIANGGVEGGDVGIVVDCRGGGSVDD